MPYVRSIRRRRNTRRGYYRRRYASRPTFPYRRIRSPMSVATCVRKMTAVIIVNGSKLFIEEGLYNVVKIDMANFTSLSAANYTTPYTYGLLGLADGFREFGTFYSQFRITGVQFEINPIIRFTRADLDITDQCKFEYLMGKQRCYGKMFTGQALNDLQDPNVKKTIANNEKGTLVNRFYISASTQSERTIWLNTNAFYLLNEQLGYYYANSSSNGGTPDLPSGCFAPGFQLGIRVTAPYNATDTTASYTYNITVKATFYLAFKGQINTTDADDS